MAMRPPMEKRMLTGLDHVVIVVADLDEAVRRYEALGFAVTPGGRHSTGTHNALIGLAGGYIELLAFLQPNPAHRWAPALQRGGGLVDVCVSSDNLAEEIARFEAAGVALEPPRAMSRTKPDGSEIQWRLSIPKGRVAGTVPFLIEDLTPIKRRRPPQRAHANKVTRIRSIQFVTGDDTAARALVGKLLPGPQTKIVDAALRAHGTRYSLGDAGFDILVPDSPSSPLTDWLAERGPSLRSMILDRDEATAGSWPASETCGVPIELAPTR